MGNLDNGLVGLSYDCLGLTLAISNDFFRPLSFVTSNLATPPFAQQVLIVPPASLVRLRGLTSRQSPRRWSFPYPPASPSCVFACSGCSPDMATSGTQDAEPNVNVMLPKLMSCGPAAAKSEGSLAHYPPRNPRRPSNVHTANNGSRIVVHRVSKAPDSTWKLLARWMLRNQIGKPSALVSCLGLAGLVPFPPSLDGPFLVGILNPRLSGEADRYLSSIVWFSVAKSLVLRYAVRSRLQSYRPVVPCTPHPGSPAVHHQVLHLVLP